MRWVDKARSVVAVLLDQVGQMALATVVAVEVHGHEHTWAAHLVRALTTQTGHLVAGINLVELEHCELDLLALVLDLLWLGVGLLLTLLASALQFQVQEQSGFLWDFEEGLKGSSSVDEALLIGWDALSIAHLLL